jgi:hypothetical protein
VEGGGNWGGPRPLTASQGPRITLVVIWLALHNLCTDKTEPSGPIQTLSAKGTYGLSAQATPSTPLMYKRYQLLC